jgi:hypothetical protein
MREEHPRDGLLRRRFDIDIRFNPNIKAITSAS